MLVQFFCNLEVVAKDLDGSAHAFGAYYAHGEWPKCWLDLHKKTPQFQIIAAARNNHRLLQPSRQLC